ncbi:nuclear transport factor 2 family protein [Algibacillus agarilyticus]|uniref:nuclear transport factor 2 family protein n=1 Tax=Algibacillus agarilyticus TaxID=2234133 RepID=UPI000DD0E3A4|nr:nuclear transport factor 2 family protein [Algibacillus agarilyticus]
MQRSDWLNNFIKNYQTLGVDNFEQLKTIYHPEIIFTDPLHKVNGISNLIHYFEQLYTHVDACNFIIEHTFETHNALSETTNDNTKVATNLNTETTQEAALYWTMTYTHRQLNKNNPITVKGHSHLKTKGDLVYFHQDYIDVGAMLYEQIPVIGRLIKCIKKRASQ